MALQGKEQLVLAGKIVVNPGEIDLGPGGDITHRRALEPVARDDLRRGVKYRG